MPERHLLARCEGLEGELRAWRNVKLRYQALRYPTKQNYCLCVFKSNIALVRTCKLVQMPLDWTELSRLVIQETLTVHPQVAARCVV